MTTTTVEYHGERGSGVFWRPRGELEWRFALGLMASNFVRDPSTEDAVKRHYGKFGGQVVARIDRGPWRYTGNDIEAALASVAEGRP